MNGKTGGMINKTFKAKAARAKVFTIFLNLRKLV